MDTTGSTGSAEATGGRARGIPEPAGTAGAAAGRSGATRRGRSRSALVTAAVWSVAAGFAAFALLRAAGLERGYPLVPLLAFAPTSWPPRSWR